MTRRRAWIVASLVFVAATAVSFRFAFAGISPDSAAALAARLRQASDPIVHAERRPLNGKPIFAVFVPSKVVLASGPAVYMVDARGAIVDFCPDVGDAPSFARRWLSGRGEPATVAEVITLLEAAATRGHEPSIIPRAAPPPIPAR